VVKVLIVLRSINTYTMKVSIVIQFVFFSCIFLSFTISPFVTGSGILNPDLTHLDVNDGIKGIKDDEGERIVGGKDAPPNIYSHQVALYTSSGSFMCGGSLIAADIVVTAAHCKDYVDVAKIGLYSQMDDSAAETINICDRIPHPNYGKMGSSDDVLLLKLCQASQLAISGTVKTIALNDDPNVPTDNQVLTVTGWGATSEGGSLAANLQMVNVNYISQQQCGTVYNTALSMSMLCAGVMAGGKDACQGDSGGPIIIQGPPFVLVGIVSWGIGCARPGYPGVYTRVSQELTWIQQEGCRVSDTIPCAIRARSSAAITPKPFSIKPVTLKPVTKMPVTKKPVTEKPITLKPVTSKPVTKKPVTEKPVTLKPVTEKPVTEKSVSLKPVTLKPVTEKPVTGKPVTSQPITKTPVSEKPVTEKPVTAKPITEQPVTGQPITLKPTTAKPVTATPVTARPITETPTTGKPTTLKPVVSSQLVAANPPPLPLVAQTEDQWKPTLDPFKLPTASHVTDKPITKNPVSSSPTTIERTDRPITKKPVSFSPTSIEPTKGIPCVDWNTFYTKFGVKRECSWVTSNPTKVIQRCQDYGEVCPITCGLCIPNN